MALTASFRRALSLTLLVCSLSLGVRASFPPPPLPRLSPKCDVVIAGGSLASLAAALTAANTSTLDICFLDPTDWPGGQLTASSVPAVDFGPENKYPANLPASFVDLLWGLWPGDENAGNCWVSVKCFRPNIVLEKKIFPALEKLSNLHVFFNTVVVNTTVDAASGKVVSISALQRAPLPGVQPWEHLLSAQLPQWYSTTAAAAGEDAALFNYTELSFTNFRVAIEATEFGDVLATSGLPLAQGFETPLETSSSYYTACGQGTTIPFFMEYLHTPAPTPDPVPPGNPESIPYSLESDSFQHVWTYRRSLAVRNSTFYTAAPGEVSNQNWAGGNDLVNAYIFDTWSPSSSSSDSSFSSSLLERKNTGGSFGGGSISVDGQRANNQWMGGVNLTALKMAEQRAYGYYHFYKNISGPSIAPYLTMNGTYTGTENRLSKMPYLRDTKRSVAGIGGFRLCYAHLATNQTNCSKPYEGVESVYRGVEGTPDDDNIDDDGDFGAAQREEEQEADDVLPTRRFSRSPRNPNAISFGGKNSATTAANATTAYRFPDTIGIGQYFYADVHRMRLAECPYAPYLLNSTGRGPVLPYHLPFRALTVQDSPNLLVAGKTMSQTFLANAATRLHPEEWVTGAAAGAAAALMATNGWTSTDMYEHVAVLQELLRNLGQPLDWTL